MMQDDGTNRSNLKWLDQLLTYEFFQEIIINEKYRLGRKIAKGGFGLVYSGTDIQSNEEVAIKLTHVRDDAQFLMEEALTCRALSGGVGMPQVLWSGNEGDYYVLVCELLGPTLEDLFNSCDRQFSLKTILLLADQAISRIAHIHSKGFVHRDIKPDNFLMGLGRKGNLLYCIDFGISERLRDPERHPQRRGLDFFGTSRYATLNNHKGLGQSWGDDLESLGYVLLYFARGSLPWQGFNAVNEEKKNELIREKKMTLPVETLCEGLPKEFATYINYTRSLGFGERPNYAYLRQLFRRLFSSRGFKYDNIFDWTEKLFYATKCQASTTSEEKNLEGEALDGEASEGEAPERETPQPAGRRGANKTKSKAPQSAERRVVEGRVPKNRAAKGKRVTRARN